MKIVLLLIINFLFIIEFKSQDTTTIIINPDLKVDFPSKPIYKVTGKVEKYECVYKNQMYLISSEPFPINYKGIEIEKANAEFYPSFTQRLIAGKNIKSLIEKDTLFENHRSKELLFIEILADGKEKYVFLKAIMVGGGIAEALYIVTLKSDKSDLLTKSQLDFLNSLDLYYNLENELTSKTEKQTKKILKKKGYKYEK